MIVQSNGSSQPGNSLVYGITGTRLFLRGVGRLCIGSLGACFQRVHELVKNHAIDAVVLDLAQCQYLDSTIMGNLIGLHQLLGTTGAVYIHHPSTAASRLLSMMGIDRLLKTLETDQPFPETMLPLESADQAKIGELLEAHQLLAGLSTENQRRFATLNRVLQDRVNR
jgi:anti-anti-sigma factor